MDKLWLIIKREYLNKVRNRTFIIMTFVSPLLFVGVAFLIGFLTSLNNDTVREVAILDETGIYAPLFEDGDRTDYIIIENNNLQTAIKACDTAGYYGLIHISKTVNNLNAVTLYTDDSPAIGFINSIEDKISKKATEDQLVQRGINLQTIIESKVKANLELQSYSGVQTSKVNGWVKMAFGGGAGYLLMMFIIIYGNMVMRSVIEEKTNRIVEIIISSVKPIYLMIGKITGTSLAGITQFLIWVILGGVLFTVASAFLGPEALQSPGNDMAMSQLESMGKIQLVINDILQLPLLKLVICFFIYFIGGYFLYAAIYTAIGAAVDNETDTQQFMMPVIIPLILSIYVGFFSVMENPHGTVAVIFSYIPLTSPIVMLMRIPFGDITYWEILLSMLILYVSIFGVAWVAAKIYRVGILMYGKKTNWKELYKWLKY